MEQIRQHGPGHLHWTMRFEGKNALPKSKKFFNFKNVPFSVSEFYQLNLSHSMWHGNGEARSGFLDRDGGTISDGPFLLTRAFVQAGLPASLVGSVGSSLKSVMCENVEVALHSDDDSDLFWGHWIS